MLSLFLISLIVANILVVDVEAIKCYSCTTTEQEIDQRCVTDPAAVPNNPILNCDKKYCITTRVEYRDPKGKVMSMLRGCLDKYTNQDYEDPTFLTYARACQTDLCNGGSGKGTPNIGGLLGDNGDAIVLLVPGIGKPNAAGSFSYSLVAAVATYVVLVLLR